MRIALMSYEYPPDTGFGGIGTYVFYQARALAKLGHDVHVFAGAKQGPDNPGTFQTESDGVKITRTKRLRSWTTNLLEDAYRKRAYWFRNRVVTAYDGYRMLIKEHARKPFDFIEAAECGADAAVTTTLLRIPTAVRFHSPARLIMGYYDTSRHDRELTSFVEQIAINQAQLLTSSSAFLAREVVAKMAETKPIHVIPNGIDLELFDRDEGIEPYSRFGLPRDKEMIFFANRMEERKGIHIVKTMVEKTLGKYPDIAFVFAGRDPDGWMEKRILPWVRDHGLQSRFFYLGHISQAEVRACVKVCSIFLIPSLWENCPSSLLEAMAAGRGVVASDCGGIPEIIESRRTGLLARNGDPESFVTALSEMIEDNVLRERCGDNARAEIENRLTDVNIARQTVDVYRGWLSGNPEPEQVRAGAKAEDAEVGALRARIAVLSEELAAARRPSSWWQRWKKPR